MSEKRPLPSPSTSGNRKKNVKTTGVGVDPSTETRAQRMKRISSEMASLDSKLQSPSTSRLSIRTRVSYEEREKKYRQFIEDKNAERSEETPPQPPLELYTKFSFNIELLKNYVIYRSITGIGRVEDKIQLGTMIREITHLISLAKVNNPSLELEPNTAFVVHQYIYQLSEIGYFGRKGKPQAIFGMPEVLIIINHCMKEAPISGNISFEYQVIVFFLIVLYTGVRPSSLSKSVKHKDAKFLQWKHVQIWRQGRDESGFKINVVIQLPHLKGRGKYFSESNRTFKKTFTSAVIDGIQYERNGDVALFICALAFKRNIPIPNSPTEWYEGNMSLLQLQEERLEEPVFINNLFGETNENPSPWTSDSAEHTTSRRIVNCGLNIGGSLYSFRRNFAQIINDNLSNATASTMMGHTPASYTLKKSYAGRFERLEMTTLVTTGEAVQGHTLDPFLNPVMFHIKDINRYKLTDEEIRDGVNSNQKVIDLFNTRAEFIKDLNKKYGSKSRDNWSEEEKKDLMNRNRLYKQARRVVTVRLTREKFRRLYEMAPQFVEINDRGEAILNENAINLPKRPDPVFQEDEVDAKDVDSISHDTDDESGEDTGNESANDDSQDDGDKEETDDEEVQNFEGEEDWGYGESEGAESGDEEEQEIEYEENQVSDQINSSQEKTEGPPDEPELPEGDRVANRNEDQRLQDLVNLVNMRARPTGKSMCHWCLEDGFESREYQGYKNLFTHLYESQSSSFLQKSTSKGGRHTNSERWLRSNLPVENNNSYLCPLEKCSYSSRTKANTVHHIRMKHLEPLIKEEKVVDATPEQVEENVKNYFREHFNHEVQDSEFTTLKQQMEHTKVLRKRKTADKARKTRQEKASSKSTGKGRTSTKKKDEANDEREGQARRSSERIKQKRGDKGSSNPIDDDDDFQ